MRLTLHSRDLIDFSLSLSHRNLPILPLIPPPSTNHRIYLHLARHLHSLALSAVLVSAALFLCLFMTRLRFPPYPVTGARLLFPTTSRFHLFISLMCVPYLDSYLAASFCVRIIRSQACTVVCTPEPPFTFTLPLSRLHSRSQLLKRRPPCHPHPPRSPSHFSSLFWVLYGLKVYLGATVFCIPCVYYDFSRVSRKFPVFTIIPLSMLSCLPPPPVTGPT